MSQEAHFAHLSQELLRRAARAVISQVGPASPALRAHLYARLTREIGSEGSFLAPPVFESLFDWALHDSPIEAEPFLSKRLITAMDAPVGDTQDFRFPRTRRPRTHQHEAWEVLCKDPVRSVLVRTGTASGKTECFMVPVLNDLACELDASAHPTPLEGVRALFLYPLNALIQSQRNRLRAWCSGFKGLVRFALYNGITKESVDRATELAHPEEVLSRTSIRRSPPPVLVTNGTMLEYMLVRGSDGPILSKSKGLLRWIVLDEAHTYLGSAAAEVALQLRRVMDAFQVDPAMVRFVATSATIGDAGDASASLKLQEFLAKLGGIDPQQVVIVDGRRVAPPLPPQRASTQLLVTPEELRPLTASERFDRLAASPDVRDVRDLLTQGHASLTDISKRFYGADGPDDRRRTLELLDVASSTAPAPGATVLLPLRGHFFARTMAGLWACCDRECTAPTEVRPQGEDWRFGAVYLERRTHCECKALCFEVHSCRTCGAEYLSAYKVDRPDGVEQWSALEPDDSDDDTLDDDEAGDDDDAGSSWDRRRVLIIGKERTVGAAAPTPMRRETGVLDDDGAASIDLAYIPVPGDNPRCFRCRDGHRGDRPLTMPARLGANFFLNVNIPTLLEQEESRAEDVAAGGPPKKPAEGRRLLTFTDSRQGSARFALRSQLGAERNYARAFIYHRLWSQARTPDPAKVEELEALIAMAKGASPMSPWRARLAEYEQRLALEKSGAPISWTDMATALSQSHVLGWVRDSMELQFPPAHSLSTVDIARLALLREFARRPRRMNSLETMGLVALDYTGLDRLGAAPQSWLDAGFRVEEWKPFIKIALDFFVRNHTALAVNRDDFRWIGAHFSTPLILAPEGVGTRNRAYPWPSAEPGKAPTRLHRYLLPMLSAGLKETEKRAQIDAILRDAWMAVNAAQILAMTDGGWRMDLTTQGRFSLIREAWLCPVTARLLDTTLRGRSPYLPPAWGGPETCTRIEMPTLAHPFPQSAGVSNDEVLRWLERDARVVDARTRGVWNEFSDRLATFSPTLYFRAGEHSAQQSSGMLKRLEEDFNKHNVNVLSCSTTMEMGVDIGGLNTVAMNNVPPAPANYRQRAGRAGRSGATRATVMTLCNTTPHGEEVFQHPTWPFTAAVVMPSVSLQSRRIAARHINALCLGRFLRAQGITDGTTLECIEFLLGSGGDAPSTKQRFVAWLTTNRDDATLAASLERLVRHTAFEGAAPGLLIDEVITSIESIDLRWRAHRDALIASLVELEGAEGMDFKRATASQKAVLFQLRRHDEEYLLRFLAAEGFLPSHGFPMHVVPFVTLTVEAFKDQQRRRELEDSRDDVPSMRNGFPSRHLSLAIREYAPGAGVVVNGMVYDSAGIALAWKRPVTEADTRDIQDLGFAWQCQQCGAADFTSERPACCPRCSSEDLHRNHMLRPTGFSVDFYSSPHNDLGRQEYVSVDEPWISASGASWSALGGTVVGRYRCTSDGTVVFRNRGVWHHGYAICLHCGRAAPELAQRPKQGGYPLPPTMQDHRRLRGGKDDTVVCTGNASSFAVRRNVVLGGVERTDVLELQLHMPGTAMPINDEVVCATLAVALRRAVAERLGVDPREIGWSVIPSHTATGASTFSLVLFDTADGGAGYVSAAVPKLREIIGTLPTFLVCPRQCDAACHGCLIGYDTQWSVKRLHRLKALDALPKAFFDALDLPDHLRVFGANTELECLSGIEAVELTIQSNTPKAIRVHLGAQGSWDLESWPLLRRLRQLSENQVAVTLVLTEEQIAALSWSEARELHQHAAVGGFQIVAAKSGPASVGGAALTVEIEATPHGRRQAIVADSAWAPGATWGAGDGSVPVLTASHDGPLPELPTRVVKLSDLDRVPSGYTQHFEWKAGALSGSVEHVGKRFWDGLTNASASLASALTGPSRLVRVRLRDRYVTSPLVIRVLYEVFSHLKRIGAADANTEFVLDTRWNPPGYNSSTSGPVAVHRGLPSQLLHKEVLSEVWREFDRGVVNIAPELHHDRVLELVWPHGCLPIYLHQGVSFLRSQGSPKVTLGVGSSSLAKEIRAKDFDVVMADSTTVHIGTVSEPTAGEAC